MESDLNGKEYENEIDPKVASPLVQASTTSYE